jgi:hypothetical protein
MKIDRFTACAPDLADHRVAPRIVQVGYDRPTSTNLNFTRNR